MAKKKKRASRKTLEDAGLVHDKGCSTFIAGGIALGWEPPGPIKEVWSCSTRCSVRKRTGKQYNEEGVKCSEP